MLRARSKQRSIGASIVVWSTSCVIYPFVPPAGLTHFAPTALDFALFWSVLSVFIRGEIYRFLRNQLLHPLHKLFRRHGAFRLLLAADTHIDRPGLGLFFADHKDKRDFLHRKIADF